MGICPDTCISDPQLVGSIVTWLGWLNSGMNPIIYACWSREFRKAFDKILFGKCCKKRRVQKRRKEMVNRIRWNRDRFKESTSHQSATINFDSTNYNSNTNYGPSTNYSPKDGLKRNFNLFSENYFPGVAGSIMSSNDASTDKDTNEITADTHRIDEEDDDELESMIEMMEKGKKKSRNASIAATFREPLASVTHASVCAISIAEVVMDKSDKHRKH